MLTFFDIAGGREGLHRFVDVFYADVLNDPQLQPLFGHGKPEHVDRLTDFLTEIFGGPDAFTRSVGGYQHIVDVHRGLKIVEPQRERFVELWMAAADKAGLPDDPRFRAMLRNQVEVGSKIAMRNSNAETDADLDPTREMPLHQPASTD